MDSATHATSAILDFFIDKISSSLLSSLLGASFTHEIESNPYISYLKSSLIDVSSASPAYTALTISKLFQLLHKVTFTSSNHNKCHSYDASEKGKADNDDDGDDDDEKEQEQEQGHEELTNDDGDFEYKDYLDRHTQPKFVVFIETLMIEIIRKNCPSISHQKPSNPVVSIYGTHRLRSSLVSVSADKYYCLDKKAAGKLDPDKAHYFLSVLVDIISSKFPAFEFQNLEALNSSPLIYVPDRNTERIDNLSGNLVVFVAHSNPFAYFTFITDNLSNQKYARQTGSISEATSEAEKNLEAADYFENKNNFTLYLGGHDQNLSDDEDLLFFKYVQLLEYASFDGDGDTSQRLLVAYFNFIKDFCKDGLNSAAKQRLLVINFMRSIKHWIAHRPKNYLEVIGGGSSEIRDDAKSLFYYMVQFLPRSPTSGLFDLAKQRNFARMLMLLICLNPNTFSDYNRNASNNNLNFGSATNSFLEKHKQLKFIHSVITYLRKEPADSASIDYADCYVLLTGISSILIDCSGPKNPIVEFVFTNVELMFNTLYMADINIYDFDKLPLTYNVKTAEFFDFNVEAMDELRICFFCFQSVLDPSFFLEFFLNILSPNSKKSLHKLLMFICGLRLYYEVTDTTKAEYLNYFIPFMKLFMGKFVHIIVQARNEDGNSIPSPNPLHTLSGQSSLSAPITSSTGSAGAGSTVASSDQQSYWNKIASNPASPTRSSFQQPRSLRRSKSQQADIPTKGSNTVASASSATDSTSFEEARNVSSSSASFSPFPVQTLSSPPQRTGNNNSSSSNNSGSNQALSISTKIYGETVNLTKLLFKHEKGDRLAHRFYNGEGKKGPRSGSGIDTNSQSTPEPQRSLQQNLTPLSFENSDVNTNSNNLTSAATVSSSSFSAANSITAYENLQYQKNMLDPVYTSKKILSNLFTIIKLSKLTFVPAIFKTVNIDTVLSAESYVGLYEHSQEDIDYLLEAIVCGLKDNDEEFFTASRDLLYIILEPYVFFERENLDEGGCLESNLQVRTRNKENLFPIISQFIDISNGVMYELMKMFHLGDTRLHSLLQIFAEVFQHQYSLMKKLFFEHLSGEVKFGFKDREYMRKQLKRLEEFFFYISCSPNIQVLQSLNKILYIVEQELNLFGFRQLFEEKDNIFRQWENRDFFRALLSFEDGNNVGGLVVFRKKIRNCMLKYLKKPIVSLFNIWVMLYNQWKQLEETKKNHTDTKSSIAKFLAMSCGILLVDIKMGPPAIMNNITDFIQYYVTSLASNNRALQFLSKSIINDELHPGAYKILANKMQTFCHDYFRKLKLFTGNDNQDSDNESNLSDRGNNEFTKFLIVDTLLTTMRAIYATNDKLLLFELSVIIVDFSLIALKALENTESVRSYQVKVKGAATFSEYISTNAMVNQAGGKLRNLYVKSMIKWLDQSITAGKRLSQSSGSMVKDPGLEGLKLKLFQGVSKALVSLSSKLSLLPLNSVYKDDLKKEKEAMIDNYFSVIFSVLNRYSNVIQRCDNDTEPDVSNGNGGGQLLGNLSTKSQNSSMTAQKVGTGFNDLITGLSNLFIYNIDVALSRSVSLGFHEDLRIKMVFYKIFINVLKNRTFDEKSSLATQRALQDRLLKLMLANPELAVAFAESCPSPEVDSLAYALLFTYDSEGKALKIIEKLIEYEIYTVTQASTVLRQNTVTSRMLYLYTKSDEGKSYLQSTIDPILIDLIYTGEFFLLEDNQGFENKDLELFLAYLTKLIDSICQSVDKFPSSYKFICYTIRRKYGEVFSTKKDTLSIVSAFVFLRFICPAIISPDTEYVMKHGQLLSNQSRNSFMLLARFVQSLPSKALNLTISRWPILTTKYDLLGELGDKLCLFLDQISQPIEGAGSGKSGYTHDSKEIIYLRKFFHDNSLYVRGAYLNPKLPNSLTLEDKYWVFMELDTVLSSLGPPTLIKEYKIPEAIKNGSGQHSKLYDFMSNFSMADTSEIMDIPFVKNTKTKDGVPVVIFSYYYYQKHRIDPKMAVYIMLQAILDHLNQKIYIVVDVTEYTNNYKLFPTGFVRSLLTEDMVNLIIDVYYLNSNSAFLEKVQSAYKNDRPLFFFKEDFASVKFKSTMDERSMVDRFPLTEHTMEIINEKKIHFNNVRVYVEQLDEYFPATLMLGAKYIQLTLNDPLSYELNGVCKTIRVLDVYHINTLQLSLPNKNTSDELFILRDFATGKKFTLLSKKRLEIMKMFHVSKSKMSEKKWQGDAKNRSGYLNQSEEHADNELGHLKLARYEESSIDVYLGDLFNLSFSGLLSEDETIRGLSNNLLLLLKEKVEFSLSSGGYSYTYNQTVPEDNVSHIVQVSLQLAEVYPHLTLRMINGFFHVFSTSSGSKNSLIAYIAPWTQNVYPYIYCSNDIKGIDNTVGIIKEFARLTQDDVNFEGFKYLIWNNFVCKDELIDIILDEVVAVAAEYHTIKKHWTKLVTIVTSYSTLTSCSAIVKKLILLAQKFEFSKSVAENHSLLTEIIILVKMCLYSFFNFKHQYESFFGELLFIVTVYSNIGNRDLKTDIYRLAYSIFQTFTHHTDKDSNDSINQQAVQVLEYLEGDTAKLIYGLFDTSGLSFKDRRQIAGSVSRFSSLCKRYLGFINTYPDPHKRKIWKARWGRYVLDLVFKGSGDIQSKSLILFGVIATDGISGHLLLRLVRKSETYGHEERDGFLLYTENFISSTFSLALCAKGLSFNKLVLFFSLWTSCCRSLTDDIVLYEAGLLLFKEIAAYLQSKLQKATDYHDVLFESRIAAKDALERYEGINGFTITPKNYEIYFCFLCFKGARISFMKNEVLETLKTIISMEWNILYKGNVDLGMAKGNFSCYLAFYFLLAKKDEFWKYVKGVEIDVKETIDLTGDDDFRAPRPVVDYLLGADTNPYSFVMLVILSYYYNTQTIDSIGRCRLLALLRYIAKHKISLIAKFYKRLLDMVNETDRYENSLSELLMITDIFKIISELGIVFSEQESEAYIMEMLEEALMTGVANYKFFDEKLAVSRASGRGLGKKIQERIDERNERFLQQQNIMHEILENFSDFYGGGSH